MDWLTEWLPLNIIERNPFDNFEKKHIDFYNLYIASLITVRYEVFHYSSFYTRTKILNQS